MIKKKFSLSKKTTLILTALLLTVALPITYLIFNRNQEVSNNWYNSSWLYRRSISVSNTSETLINEDILIQYDTSALISAGKLKPNCDDLRFLDSDDSTALTYWIEGGCNTSTTQIWVRIPSLTKSGKTIYMYYGNSSATNAQEDWGGKFYLLRDSSCTDGWETESNSDGHFYQRFPKGSHSFGTTGGQSKHTHPKTTILTDIIKGKTKVNNESQLPISQDHSHEVIITTNQSDVDILPPYLDMIFCSNSDLIIEKDSIVLFDGALPQQFTRYSQLDDKFPRGNSEYGNSNTEKVHTHTINTTITSQSNSNNTCQTGTTYISSNTHSHEINSLTLDQAEIIPEYLSMIYAQSNSNNMAPSNTVLMSSELPPLGWTLFTQLENKFPYASTSVGTTGGSSTHTHTLNMTTSNENNTVGCSTTGATTLAPTTHTHSLLGTLQSASNNPPYIETLFVKKKSSLGVSINNEENPNIKPNSPTSLQTNGVVNPEDILDLTPTFSAIFTDPNSNDSGEYFEIEVNTDPNFSGTVIWNLEKTRMSSVKNGERNTGVKYNGSKLTPSIYYWRIRFWDNKDIVSDWSNTAKFTVKTGTPLAINETLEKVLGMSTQNYYSESEAESTWSTDTNYQDKTSITFTPDSNSTYLILSSWLMRQTTLGTGYFVQGKLTRTTDTAKDFNELIYYPKDATDYISGGSIGIDSFGETPSSQTYKIQYKTTSATRVARIKAARIIALKLDNNIDKYSQAESRTTTTSTTYQDKTTLTFTPNTAGDYIILASATVDGSSTSYDYRTRLTIDGTAYSTVNIETNLAANRMPWFVVKRINLSAASHTIKIQYSSENAGNTTGIADARIVAIRADRFLNNYYAENETRATTTSTSYQTYLTLTQTPQATDHLVLAVQDLDASSTSYSTYGQALIGSTSYGEMLQESKNATGRGNQYFTLKKESLSNTSTSWYLQYRSGNAAATAGINNGRILLLEMTEPTINIASSGTQTSSVFSNTSNFYTGGAFTLVRDSGSDAITSITVNQTGTISDSNISGLILYYKQESTCSSSIPVDATQFNSTAGTFSSGSSTVTGSMSVGTSQICLYTEVDIGTANVNDTIELQITDPSTQILASRGVTPATTVSINGTTTVASSNSNPNAPSSLYTQGSTNPTKVSDTTPEFSAIFTDSNATDTANYYEIEVNSNNSFTGTVMWDSNKTAITPITNGQRSPDISYSGTSLTLNGTTYYWRIKYWDNNGGESTWSSTATFTMSGSPNTPSDLLVNSESNPTQLPNKIPLFTALYSDPNGDSAIYYEIEVNSNNSFTGTVIWDSGKTSTNITNNSRSPNISYSGTALTGTSSNIYYWRIRFWDSDDNVSEWSSTANFTDFVQTIGFMKLNGIGVEGIKIF